MKNKFLLAVSVFLVFASCNLDHANPFIHDEPARPPSPFIIKIDSVTHPSVVALNDTVIIQFYGFVGSTYCEYFSHIDVTQTSSQVDFTVWGDANDSASAGGCPAYWHYLTNCVTTIVALKKGSIALRIYQPNGTILTDSISVN